MGERDGPKQAIDAQSAGQSNCSGTAGSGARAECSSATVASSARDQDDLATERIETDDPDGGEVIPPLEATEVLDDDRATRRMPENIDPASSDSSGRAPRRGPSPATTPGWYAFHRSPGDFCT